MILNVEISIDAIRNWLLLILAIIGAFITIKTYISSIKQKRIENTFKIVEFLRTHISEADIKVFIELFHANNENSGGKYNEFILENGNIDTIENMFSEGGVGNGSIHNIIEIFNLISPTLNNLDINIIWFEYGQIMLKVHQWTKYLEEKLYREEKSYKNIFFYNFNKFMKKHERKQLFKPIKYYTYTG